MNDDTPHVSNVNGPNSYVETFYHKGALSPKMNVFSVPIDSFVYKGSGQARELTGKDTSDMPNILYVLPEAIPYDDVTANIRYQGKSVKKRPSGVLSSRNISDTGIMKTGPITWDSVRSILIADGKQDGLENRTVNVTATPNKFASME